MPKPILPEMKPIPEGATKADRQKLYDDYVAEIRRLNPSYFNVDGKVKNQWQWLMGGE